VVDGQLVNETKSSPQEEVEKVAVEADENPGETATVEVNMNQTET